MPDTDHIAAFGLWLQHHCEAERVGRLRSLVTHRCSRCESYPPGRDTKFSIGIASTRDNFRNASALPGFLLASISAR